MGALDGLRVLDLSRVLAGPICTQMLGDFGADIIKIEKPFEGDDTRKWGPPFLKDANGQDTTESAYYLCANRNKKSVAVDLSKPEGQDIILSLLEHCDVLIENFKVGGLKKYGLDYAQLKEKFPRLIYCGISGFGQAGPLAQEPGYDFLAQGMGGLMASTGGPDQPPTKAGVAVSDYIAGLNATIGILAALQSRTQTGLGQMVDVSLLASTIAMMTNLAQYTLTSGQNPPRVGNAHTTIVPYQSFETADGHINIAVGNDHQFKSLCVCIGHPEWSTDEKFSTNSARVIHRDIIVPLLAKCLKEKSSSTWLQILRDADVPCGPILPIRDVFALDQTQSQQMTIQLPHPLSPTPVSLVANPIKLSGTPTHYQAGPPVRGQHTREVLQKLLNFDDGQLAKLQEKAIIEIT